ncbi:FecR domain-containing protein [Fulvivirgaceae bacterium BMA12]|uniref:FecR domain-containing protein n=1 Tax=Agaribacillus aureus TaxID=3051825 RepID=A0ABT8LB90_9BACT|nr:FecR domain-containing protein [Fulvivirgaceae bacterium BMA12]
MSGDTFFRKWLEGNLSDEEISSEGPKVFKDDKEFATFKKLIDGSQGLKIPASQGKEDAWSKLVDKIESNPSKAEPGAVVVPFYKKPIFKYLSIAASLAIIFIAYATFFTNNPTTYKTAKSEIKTITMPDNSLITLNADSKLSFKSGNWIDNRSVSLEGEAFFEVKKGTKFVVNSEIGKVTVLGTSFNVKARKEGYEVSCFTGEVSVSLFNDKSEKVLSNGFATKIMNQKLSEPFTFKPTNIAGWKSGEYYFDKQPLIDVFEEFDRQFDVTLKITTDISGRIYSGYFNKVEMEKALELICLPMDLQYEIQDNTIIIY